MRNSVPGPTTLLSQSRGARRGPSPTPTSKDYCRTRACPEVPELEIRRVNRARRDGGVGRPEGSGERQGRGPTRIRQGRLGEEGSGTLDSRVWVPEGLRKVQRQQAGLRPGGERRGVPADPEDPYPECSSWSLVRPLTHTHTTPPRTPPPPLPRPGAARTHDQARDTRTRSPWRGSRAGRSREAPLRPRKRVARVHRVGQVYGFLT